MILLTDELREQLLANGRDRDADHIPVVKFFNPLGEGVWLATELDEDGDTLFGLADLGFGCPEMGCFSLTEIASIQLPYGLSIERDLHFTGHFPLTVYADAARIAGQITENESLLATAARAQHLLRAASDDTEILPDPGE